MRFTTFINNKRCMDWGLNANQGALFDLINQAAGWAKPVTVGGEVFYWISRQLVIEQLPLYYSKPDTVYRAFRTLQEKGLINYCKHGEWELINITDKGKLWNVSNNEDAAQEPDEPRKSIRTPPSSIRELGNKSDLLGNKSESPRIEIRNSSEINPTNKDISNKLKNDKRINKRECAREPSADAFPARPERFDAWAVLSDMGVERKHFDAWMQARKRKRLSSPIDEVALAAFFREIGKVGLTAHDAARMCAEKGWGSIESNWDCFRQRTPQRGYTFEQQGSAEQYAQEQAERMRPQIAAMFAAKEKRDD